MKICGIVCEYNPFHNGHRVLIDECRRRHRDDSAVGCVMSGDFVQRGEAAAYLKHDRARAAVAGGADLVLELPLPWSLAGAETFARGAVGLLGASGIVTHLCFGSESGDLPLLRETAQTLSRPELDELLPAAMTDGTPYAAARQKAVETLMGKPAAALTRLFLSDEANFGRDLTEIPGLEAYVSEALEDILTNGAQAARDHRFA